MHYWNKSICVGQEQVKLILGRTLDGMDGAVDLVTGIGRARSCVVCVKSIYEFQYLGRSKSE